MARRSEKGRRGLGDLRYRDRPRVGLRLTVSANVSAFDSGGAEIAGPPTLMYRTAIVAHKARSEAAHALFTAVDAAFLAMDNGSLGCKRNHLRAWTYMTHHNPEPWSIVLEDDCVPVHDFPVQQALAAAPAPIVSFYLGTGYPPQMQDRIRQAVAAADREQGHWITGNHLHGVAVAVRTELLPDMLDWVGKSSQPIDYAIRDWARSRHHDIAFTHPSIVDHADQGSVA